MRQAKPAPSPDLAKIANDYEISRHQNSTIRLTAAFDWQTHSTPACVSSFVNREVCKRYPFRVRT